MGTRAQDRKDTRKKIYLTIVWAFVLLCAWDLSFASAKVDTYEELLQAIRVTHDRTEAKIKALTLQEKIQEKWETGNLINEHVLLHKEADYGKFVINRLAKDLNTNSRELRYRVEFVRAYPQAEKQWKLKWSYYEALLAINDPQKRSEIEKQVLEENWTIDRIRREVKRRNLGTLEDIELEEAKPGKVGVYQVVRAAAGPYQGQLVLDLGFSNYFKFGNMDEFKEGDLVFAEPVKQSKKGLAARFNFKRILPLESREQIHIATEKNPIYGDASMLNTYPAFVMHVHDGDTFTAMIDLGFGITTEQRLRLRRVDAPELIDTDGADATAALEKALACPASPAPCPAVVKVAKSSDQYGRGLAEVWVCSARSGPASADGTRTTRDECNGKDISQDLLASGFFTVREKD